MRSLWITSLAVSLGLLVTAARAQEGPWRAVGTAPPSAAPAGNVAASSPAAAALGKPIARSQPAPPCRTDAVPAAQLGKPVPIARTRVVDASVRPVNFSSPPDSPGRVVRGASPDDSLVRPMPTGPVAQGGPVAPWSPGLNVWRRGNDPLPSSDPMPGPAPGNNVPLLPGAPVASTYPSANNQQPGLPGSGPSPSLFATGCDGSCGCGPTCASGNCSGAPNMGCSSCNGCPSGNRWYVGLEYLVWGMKGDPTPPLVSQGANTTQPGFPPSSVLYGDTALGTKLTSGARLTAGWWFSDAQIWGLQVGGFFLGPTSNHYRAASLGSPILGRPILDLRPFVLDPTGTMAVTNPAFGQPSQEFVALPGVLSGVVDVSRRSTLWGAEANLTRGLWCCPNGYLNLLLGYRQLGLDESLTITESLLSSATAPPTMFTVQDRFSTSNRFYGGQVGLAGVYLWNRLSFGFQGKVAMGLTQQWANISGSTTVQPIGGVAQTGPGGLLALGGTNIGHYYHDRFGFVPEAQFTLGYQLRPWCRLTVGYNFLYWSSVIRPGGLLDTGVNASYQPFAPINPGNVPASANPARPAPLFGSTDFWAQGLTLGVQFTW